MTDTSRRGIEGRYYTDPQIFERELDTVFARTWQMVGHVSQLAGHGDVITATVGRERVVVSNDNGTIHGFHNVCAHRGHELVPEGTTNLPAIVCGYHAWSYDLAGNLVRARRIPAERLGGICVPRVRVDTMAGFVFVNCDPDAEPLDGYAPGISARLSELVPDAAQRRLTARLTHTFEANWKVAVENYNECYHCPNVHTAFTSGVVDPATFMITPQGNNVVQTASAIAGDAMTYDLGAAVSGGGSQAVDEPGSHRPSHGATRGADGDFGVGADSGSETGTEYASFFTWPVSSIQCYPGRVLNTFRWVPLAVDRTLLIREWWFDTDSPSDAQQEIIDLDWNTTVAEDFDLMESVQRNMGSRGYVPGPLMVDESGTADVHHENAVPHLQALALQALGEP